MSKLDINDVNEELILIKSKILCLKSLVAKQEKQIEKNESIINDLIKAIQTIVSEQKQVEEIISKNKLKK